MINGIIKIQVKNSELENAKDMDKTLIKVIKSKVKREGYLLKSKEKQCVKKFLKESTKFYDVWFDRHEAGYIFYLEIKK